LKASRRSANLPRLRNLPGLFLTFEGIEGSGKSTQVEMLAARLLADGWTVRVVREPGGTALGEDLRRTLLAQAEEPIDSRAELLLYLASRAQLVERIAIPALRSGALVLADRFGDASVAYQGAGRGLGEARVRSLVRFATGGLVPDRTYLLDLPPEEGLPRARARGALDRLEGEDIRFHRAVRRSYRGIASREPSRVLLLDGRVPADRIAERILRDARSLLPFLRRSDL